MNPVIKLNVLARDVENAQQIVEEMQGRVFIGVMVKSFASIDLAVATIEEFQAAKIPVSVGLGGGDPAQWKKVVDVAIRTKPAHVNQVFPASGFTLGALKSVGSHHTLVNALIQPSGTPGKVIIATGPMSRNYQEVVSCDTAAAMLAEIGVQSVKFYPIEGTKRLDEVAEMVKASVRQGIKTFEPTGGMDAKSLSQVLDICIENGAEQIIPHVYTSIVDKATGLTRLEDIRELMQIISSGRYGL